MAELVGYKLVNVSTNEVVQTWGGTWGQCPGLPNPLVLPNGDQVAAAALNTSYSGYPLIRWDMEPPAPSTDPADYPLTARQIRLGLIRNGVSLAVVQTAIDNLPSPARDEAQVYWEFSAEVHWEHPMTQSLMALVGITPAQAEEMWFAAKDYEL
jgi:hypothetical protein